MYPIKEELWKDIKGYEGLYQVSNLGRVKSLNKNKVGRYSTYLKKGKILSCNYNHNRYGKITLYKNGKHKEKRVHRLVAEAFIPNPDNKPQVNHIDNNSKNNKVENLEWVTVKENVQHAYKIGATKTSKIRQYNLSGKVVKEWNSQKEASLKTKINKNSICECCKGKRKTAGGYIWKYKEEI